LTYSNYYLFLNLKNFYCGVHCPNNERLKSVVESWKPRSRDRYKTPYDIICYNDVISALSSHEFRRNERFIGVQIFKSFSV